MEFDPLGIFVATLCTGGEKLLFRYPNEAEEAQNRPNIVLSHSYALNMSLVPQYSVCKESELTNIKNGIVVGFEDSPLANLLIASKSNLPKKRYEVKVGDVIFVGCPHETEHNPRCNGRHANEKVTFNIVFALQARINSHFIPLYQDLSEKISLALIHEEERTGFMSKQKQTMIDMYEIASQTHPSEKDVNVKALQSKAHERASVECPLGIFLRNVYESICEFGSVDLFLNNWVRVSFTISPKVPRGLNISVNGASNGGLYSKKRPPLFPKPSLLQDYFREMRPYHSFLLLEEKCFILERLTLDCSPLLVRLLRICTPLKSIDQMASEMDVALTQVRRIICSLVTWGFAMLIYPIYDSNVYLLSPGADLSLYSPCNLDFSGLFPSLSLHRVLEGFSSPYSFGHHREGLKSPRETGQDTKVLVWLLQHRLVYQLHTYPYIDQFTRREGSTGHRAIEVDSPTFNVDARMSNDTGKSYLIDSLEDASAFDSTNQDDQQNAHNSEEEQFYRLAKDYFNGRYHLEAIMYRESIGRTELCHLIDRFRDRLYILKHEEPYISYWVNPDL